MAAWDGNLYGARDVVVTVTNVDEDGTVSLSSVQPQAGTELRAVLSDPDGSVTGLGWVGAEAGYQRRLVDDCGRRLGRVHACGGDEDWFLRATASYSDGQGPSKEAEAVSANRVQPAPFTNTAPEFPSSEDGRREVAENTPAAVLAIRWLRWIPTWTTLTWTR